MKKKWKCRLPAETLGAFKVADGWDTFKGPVAIIGSAEPPFDSRSFEQSPGKKKLAIPLCSAVMTGKLQVVKSLVEVGADINAYCSDTTPLSLSLVPDYLKSLEIAKYLISKGADFSRPLGGRKKSNSSRYLLCSLLPRSWKHGRNSYLI